MSIRTTLLAAAALLVGTIGAASAGDTKRVLGEAELDSVNAGISFGFQIGRTVVNVLNLANPTNVQPTVLAVEVPEEDAVPFAIAFFDLNFRFPSTTTSVARSSSRTPR